MRNALLGLSAAALLVFVADSARAERNDGPHSPHSPSVYSVAHGHDYHDYFYGHHDPYCHHGAYSSRGHRPYYPPYHGSHPPVAIPHGSHWDVVTPWVPSYPSYRGHGGSPYHTPHHTFYYRGNNFGFSFGF